MDEAQRQSAASERQRILAGQHDPRAFRAALEAVPEGERDVWIDTVLGLDPIPPDGPIPRGCVPYLPCSVANVLRFVELAEVGAEDLFVDIGGGVGRAAALVHLVCGARTLCIEIQPGLAAAARQTFAELGLHTCEVSVADVCEPPFAGAAGTAFFLYCPFGGTRLAKFLDVLAEVASRRDVRIGCVDLSLPARPWLASTHVETELSVWQSVPLGREVELR